MDRFWQALMHLLPPGFAFPRNRRSAVMAWLGAWAAVLREHHEFVDRAIRQWMPHRTCSRLEEWEEALGLPDSCVARELDEEERRTAMLARLRGDLDLTFADSSADSIGAMTNYLAAAGYECEIWVNYPFRVGQNRVGDRLGRNGILYVYPVGLCRKARVGKARVGDRLVACQPEVDDLYCLLKRIVPSRFEIELVPDID
ncbi:tail protein [Burkholderia aenigmatica]|uniref:Tail protein n=1 Tax=Burkholderia aenigmatica TaxID=2015348 RepID=A0A6P2NKK9_9BURK|nr:MULTISPECIES: putative phage tail protein [Burkholderia]VWB95189.1 tail protein [Burkholderia aenigmatica]